MFNYKLTIEYDGSHFHGWQIQKDVTSIQGAIIDAIYKYTNGTNVNLICAGRTDAGVHAVGQVANFHIDQDYNLYSLKEGINYYLKNKNHSQYISILNVEKVNLEFHSRFSAKSRIYKYQIINRRARLTFERNFYYHVSENLNIYNMQKASKFFLGEHDFSSFRASSCQSKNPIKNMMDFRIENIDNKIIFWIEANAFLHHQVRNMVGTLIEIGKGRKNIDYIQQLLLLKDRTQAGMTAPAHGLFFMDVKY